MKKITPGIVSATQKKTPVYQILCDSLNFSMLPVWARIMKRTVPVNRLIKTHNIDKLPSIRTRASLPFSPSRECNL